MKTLKSVQTGFISVLTLYGLIRTYDLVFQLMLPNFSLFLEELEQLIYFV